jgi:hypothetical protein
MVLPMAKLVPTMTVAPIVQRIGVQLLEWEMPAARLGAMCRVLAQVRSRVSTLQVCFLVTWLLAALQT